MAACAKCGGKAGFGKKLCPECSAQEESRARQAQREREEAEHAAALERQRVEAERKRQEQEARQKRLDAFIEKRLALLQDCLDQGLTPCLYAELVLDSQSYFNESAKPNAWNFRTATGPLGNLPDLTALQAAGWQGWEVIGLVPITFGSTLYNTVGGNTVYAAAYGGMVVGARVLLRLPITKESLVGSRDAIVARLEQEFPG